MAEKIEMNYDSLGNFSTFLSLSFFHYFSFFPDFLYLENNWEKTSTVDPSTPHRNQYLRWNGKQASGVTPLRRDFVVLQL
jgi:hypothetical protein